MSASPVADPPVAGPPDAGPPDAGPPAAGPPAAPADFDAVFSTLLPRLYRRAVVLAGDSAQDAVHDTYLKLRRYPRQFTTHPVPYAYAFRALVSVVHNNRRRRAWHILTDQVPDTPDPVGPVVLREAEWQVRWLLSQLTVKQAAAVLLVDLDAHTIDEAAAVLGVHRGTVARARSRALSHLRTLLKDADR
ncbi:RNA polymerase sigma factor [Kitasatospora sp. MAA4]|uniref:RNA polymerase sigma factor n=1 Tax=Kitasatospora sp. MAA4 TaxID=3035093 RepID=UPI002475637D|nr:RNA polymerase sigma factor [Kitasatospora sp. MAA4]